MIIQCWICRKKVQEAKELQKFRKKPAGVRWNSYQCCTKHIENNFNCLSAVIQCSGTRVWKEILWGWKIGCKIVNFKLVWGVYQPLHSEGVGTPDYILMPIACQFLFLSTARSIQTKDGRAGGHEGDHPFSHGSVNYHTSSLHGDKADF